MCTKTWHEIQPVYCLCKKIVKVESSALTCAVLTVLRALVTLQVRKRGKKFYKHQDSICSTSLFIQ